MVACVAIGCRVILAAVFSAAVAGKVVARAEFGQSLRHLGRVPARFVRPMMWLVLTAESLAIALLAAPVPVATLAGFALSTMMLGLFTGAVVRTIRNGDQTPCACFGQSSSPLSLVHVLRNGLLVVTGVVGFAATAAPAQQPRADPGAVVLVVAAGLLVAGLIARIDDIVALYRPVRARPRTTTARSRAPLSKPNTRES